MPFPLTEWWFWLFVVPVVVPWILIAVYGIFAGAGSGIRALARRRDPETPALIEPRKKAAEQEVADTKGAIKKPKTKKQQTKKQKTKKQTGANGSQPESQRGKNADESRPSRGRRANGGGAGGSAGGRTKVVSGAPEDVAPLRCRATTARGRRCRNRALPNGAVCSRHAGTAIAGFVTPAPTVVEPDVAGTNPLRCIALTKKGVRCRNRATGHTALCTRHLAVEAHGGASARPSTS